MKKPSVLQNQLRRLAIFVICVSPVLRLLLGSYHVNLYSNTFSRLDGLMAGALIAVVISVCQFCSIPICQTGMDCLFHRVAPHLCVGGSQRALDRVLPPRGRFSLSDFPLAVLQATLAAKRTIFEAAIQTSASILR